LRPLSARYAGELADDQANNFKLLKNLHGHSDRFAYYVCVLVWVRSKDDPMPLVVQEVWCGQIIETPKGNHGFGYDPYFFIPELGCTAAELDLTQKNQLSHRGKAIHILFEKIRKIV
jgi:XTP/dITP diphosphohydrolase